MASGVKKEHSSTSIPLYAIQVCIQTALPLSYDTITDIGIWPQARLLGLFGL